MARGVQQGDGQVPQGELRLLGEDGDAPLPLHLVGVQKGVPVVHPAQAADGPAPVQQSLGEGGFSGVHMSQDAQDQLVHGSTSDKRVCAGPGPYPARCRTASNP